MTTEQIKDIAEQIADNILFCTKDVLTSDEAAKYMGVAKSHLYKLTSKGGIPHYKPKGKLCYFSRAELKEWLLQNRCATAAELSDKAADYCKKGGKV